MQDQDKTKEQLIEELKDMRLKMVGFEAVQKSLSEKESRYRESEQRLELALEGGALGVWDWDVKTGRAIWDTGTTRMMGYEQNELDPNIRTWKRAVHPDDWEKVSEVLNGHLSGRLPFYEVEYRMRTKSGEWKWVQVRGKVVQCDKAGKPQRMTGTMLDVTERRQAEEESEKLRLQLMQSQKMEALGILVGGIAHDFNNMLQIVLGYSQLLLRGKKESDPGYKDIQTIIETVKGGADLVKKLLAFGQQSPTFPVNMDLNHQIRELIPVISRTLPDIVKIDFDLTHGPVMINADPNQIDQVIMNLAINASEAMPNGGTIKMATKTMALEDEHCRLYPGVKPGKYVVLSLSDTGRGMDKETLARVFEPFFSTKQRGSTRGTGLGLSVVQGIVEKHGGYVTCKSEPGKGSQFRIYFPEIDYCYSK
ncbi:MAG: two-component system sensor histidine kinase NtrB [Desulfomonilaceae bacterium]